MKEQELPQISLTQPAAAVFLKALKDENVDIDTSFLRVSVRPGGCSGYKFNLEHNSANERKPEDIEQQSSGVKILVDKTVLVDVLGNLTIDYTTKNMVEQGFVFSQMVNGRLCGCGESFRAIKDLEV